MEQATTSRAPLKAPLPKIRYSLLVRGANAYVQRAWSVRNILGLHATIPVVWSAPAHLARPGAANRATRTRASTVEVIDHTGRRILEKDGLWLPRELEMGWLACCDPLHPELYPDEKASYVDATNMVLHDEVFLGLVCPVGPSGKDDLEVALARLAQLENTLTGSSYALGDNLTDVDLHLHALLVRLDPALAKHHPRERTRLADFPHLRSYQLQLHHLRGVGICTPFGQIERDYGVPQGSGLEDWSTMWGPAQS